MPFQGKIQKVIFNYLIRQNTFLGSMLAPCPTLGTHIVTYVLDQVLVLLWDLSSNRIKLNCHSIVGAVFDILRAGPRFKKTYGACVRAVSKCQSLIVHMSLCFLLFDFNDRSHNESFKV